MLKLLKFLTLLNIYYCHTYVGCSNLMLVPTRPGVFSSLIIASTSFHLSEKTLYFTCTYSHSHEMCGSTVASLPIPTGKVKAKANRSIKGRPVDLVFGHADLSFCDLSFIFHRAVLKLGRV